MSRFRLLAVGALLTVACSSIPTEAQDASATTANQNITLDARRTDVEIKVASTSVAALGSGDQIYLKLEGVSTPRPTDVTYNVYLNLPAALQPNGVNDPHYAGTLSLYDVTGQSKDLALNVTSQMTGIIAKGELRNSVRVTLVPAGDAMNSPVAQVDRILVTTK